MGFLLRAGCSVSALQGTFFTLRFTFGFEACSPSVQMEEWVVPYAGQRSAGAGTSVSRMAALLSPLLS